MLYKYKRKKREINKHQRFNLLGLEINEARPHDKLPYRGAWLWVGAEMIHLMELPNPDPLSGRPEHGGRDRHTCIAIRDVSKLKRILDKAGKFSLLHLSTSNTIYPYLSILGWDYYFHCSLTSFFSFLFSRHFLHTQQIWKASYLHTRSRCKCFRIYTSGWLMTGILEPQSMYIYSC